MSKWKPVDCFAIIIGLGGLALLFSGIDSFVGTLLIVLTAAYYGIDLTPWFKLGRFQNKKEEEKK